MFKELQLAIIESYCDFACSTCVPHLNCIMIAAKPFLINISQHCDLLIFELLPITVIPHLMHLFVPFLQNIAILTTIL
jgi:hypothetical protein